MPSKQEIETMRSLRSQGYKLSYITYKTGRDAKTIMKYAPTGRKYKLWSTEEFQKAISLRKFGFTYRQIAEQLGRSTVAVSQMFYKLEKQVKI